MPTPAERKALFFLAGIALLGTGARAVSAVRSRPTPNSAAAAALARQRAAVESARADGGKKKGARRSSGRRTTSTSAKRTPERAGGAPVARGPARGAPEPVVVDLDRATAAEIDRLPRVGPTLAGRIVADREAYGAFGSLEGLRRVRGVGCGMLRALAPHVTFSLSPRQSAVQNRGPPSSRTRACAAERRPP